MLVNQKMIWPTGLLQKSEVGSAAHYPIAEHAKFKRQLGILC